MSTPKSVFLRPLLAGAVPLLLGGAVYELWRFTRADWLLAVGAGVILLGVAATLWGSLAFLEDKARVTTWDRRSRVRQALAAVLMVACYPVAIWLTLSAAQLMTSYEVTVRNESGQSLTSCRLVTHGIDDELGPIPPGETATHRMNFQADGDLRCLAESADGTRHRIMVEGYVTLNLGGEARLVFDAEGTPRLDRR